MVGELQKVLEPCVPLVQRAVEGLRIGEPGDTERPPFRDQAHRQLAPAPGVRRDQAHGADLAAVNGELRQPAFEPRVEASGLVARQQHGVRATQRRDRLAQPPGG